MSRTTSCQGQASLETARIDLRKHWAQGERIQVETYLERLPAIRSDPQFAVDLIYSEYLIREELGDSPHSDDYLKRFPHFADELRFQFEVHHALSSRFADSFIDPQQVFLSSPADGRTLGRFQIIDTLGVGSFATVYLGRDPKLDSLVAIKFPHSGILTCNWAFAIF